MGGFEGRVLVASGDDKEKVKDGLIYKLDAGESDKSALPAGEGRVKVGWMDGDEKEKADGGGEVV